MPRLFDFTETCDCGTRHKSSHRARHHKSNQHRNWLLTRSSGQIQHLYNNQPAEYYQEPTMIPEQYNQYNNQYPHQPLNNTVNEPMSQLSINISINEHTNPHAVYELIREIIFRCQSSGITINSTSTFN